jgi:hypothetical protein
MIHWCDKCNRLWVSVEKPESEVGVSKGKGVERETKFSGLDMDEATEARDYLQRFRTSKP